MKNLNEHRFEDEWRNAFREAESSPHADVWARVDAHLANQESERYKRKLIWYQRIAAAVTLLLLSTGGAWYWLGYERGKNDHETIAVQSRTQQTGTSRIPTNPGDLHKGPGNSPSVANTPTDPALPTPAESAVADRPTADENTIAARPPQSAVGTERAEPDGTPTAVGPAKLPNNRQTTGNRKIGGELAAIGKVTSERTSRQAARHSGYGSEPVHANNARGIARNPADAPPVSAEQSTVSPNEKADPVKTDPTYALLAGRTISPKTSAIRTPLHLPQLTELYLAQLKGSETKEEAAEKEKGHQESRWQVGLAFAPASFNPNMKLNEGSAGFQAVTNNVFRTALSADQDGESLNQANRELESARPSGLSYQSGLRLEYALSKKISLQGGVDYLHNQSSITTTTHLNNLSNGDKVPVYASLLNYNNQVASESITASDGMESSYNLSPAQSVIQSQQPIQVQNTYEYVSVPVRVNYHLVGNKLGAVVGAGVSADVFLKNTMGNESAGFNEQKLASTKGTAYRNLGLSAWLGMKLQYRFAKRYSAFIEPGYRRAVTSFTNSEALQSHPYAFSIGTGLQVRL